MRNLLLLMLLAFVSGYVNAQCGSPSYTEPDFTIAVQNPECPKVGEIKVTSANGGVGPYTYTLLPTAISNSTGQFSNLAPGTYVVQLRDACGTVRARQATITPYNFSSTSNYSSLECSQFIFNINCSANGPALQYGYSIDGGPISWGNTSSIDITPSLPANVTLYVRDSCGNQASTHHYLPEELGGYIKELNERIECDHQEIYPVYYGFNSPRVCLYKSPQNTLVECKYASTPNYSGGPETNFYDLPFGQDYYVIIEDGCYRDSAFFKDKTSAGGVEINPFNLRCTTFDLHADGNNSGIACLYNAANDSLIGCKPTNDTAINPNTGDPWPYGGAEWYNLPYGTYYSFIYDPCMDSLLRIDTTVTYPLNFKAEMRPYCSIYESGIGAFFGPESPAPHKTTIYYPDGTIAGTYNYEGYLIYPTWPSSGTLTVIQEDGCGYRDTSQIFQPPILPTRTVVFKGACPGVTGTSGGGDVVLSGNKHAFAGVITNSPIAPVKIIRKDNIAVDIHYSYTEFNAPRQEQDYYFPNLTTGTYVLESLIGCNGVRILDTVEVKPYMYPVQEQTHISQCGANAFVFRDTVTGGLAPFTYEIIATNPNTPTLLTGPQSSNLFSMPPGTNLNTITIQVIDKCGNSNTKVYPINQLGSCLPLPVDNPTPRNTLQNRNTKIFPNPSSGRFSIAFFDKKAADYEISVLNAAGVKIHATIVKDIDTKTVEVDKKFNAGVYIIRIRNLRTNTQEYIKHVVQ